MTNWEECVDCMSAHLKNGCTNHKLYSEYSIVIVPEGYDWQGCTGGSVLFGFSSDITLLHNTCYLCSYISLLQYEYSRLRLSNTVIGIS
jgi:hypothetical protein